MPKLKSRVVAYLIVVSILVTIMTLALTFGEIALSQHANVRAAAETFFSQLDGILSERPPAPGQDRAWTSQELVHILTLLKAGTPVQLYAFDPDTGLAEGSSLSQEVGLSAEELGFGELDLSQPELVDHAVVHGQRSYCIFSTVQGYRVAYVMARSDLYSGVGDKLLLVTLVLAGIAVVLVLCVTWYINRFVIRSIHTINTDLAAISNGNLEVRVQVTNTEEFAQLSKHINDMINSVLSTTDVLSYIINKTDISIGVYLYDTRMHYVRCTDHLPELLMLDREKMRTIFADFILFREYIRKIRRFPVAGEKNIYRLPGSQERYLRIDEAVHLHYVLGIVLDMTEEMSNRKRIESERDMDLLTGLLNRYGLRNQLNLLFEKADKLGHGALFMIDADDLKMVNDVHGHSQGDRYLIGLSSALRSFGSRRRVAARLGGDEFVLFLYGYDTDQDLEEDLARFAAMQDTIPLTLRDAEVRIRFSYGCVKTQGQSDYSALLRQADDRMYAQKRSRKETRQEETTGSQ